MALCFNLGGINILYFLGYVVCWVLRNLQTVSFFRVDVPVSILTPHTLRSSSSAFLLACGVLGDCFSSHPGKYAVMSHCNFNLYAAKMLTSLCVLVCHVDILLYFWKHAISYLFVHFLSDVLNFFLFSFQMSGYILTFAKYVVC